MIIPDYVSPIVGYRVWQWDAVGLKSLNGELWLPGQWLSAICRADSFSSISGLRNTAHDPTELPRFKCTCGVYAAKSIEHLHRCSYGKFSVHGEVYLWGRVVEHERGWRAEFAYPKSMFLLPTAIPFSLSAIDARLKTLTGFGTDIFVQHDHERTRLWTNRLGYDPAGLDYLIRARRDYYVRRQAERALKEGDRVAIIGRGIGVVKDTSPHEVIVVLGKMTPICITRREIIRDHQNNRWEWNPITAEGSKYASSNLCPSQHQGSKL